MRADAANKQRTVAIAAAQAAPNDGYKSALVDAWTTIINKANNRAIVASDTSSKSSSDAAKSGDSGGAPSWFSQKTGPVPNWGLAAGGAAVAAGLAKKFLF